MLLNEASKRINEYLPMSIECRMIKYVRKHEHEREMKINDRFRVTTLSPLKRVLGESSPVSLSRRK